MSSCNASRVFAIDSSAAALSARCAGRCCWPAAASEPAQQRRRRRKSPCRRSTDPVPLELTYTARTVGSREVEVRARVGGILLKRRFEEGSRVRQGQPMFLIDPEPVRARAASARAEVAVAKARAGRGASPEGSCAAAVRAERGQPEPARRSGVGVRSRAGQSRRGRIAICAWRSSISNTPTCARRSPD